MKSLTDLLTDSERDDAPTCDYCGREMVYLEHRGTTVVHHCKHGNALSPRSQWNYHYDYEHGGSMQEGIAAEERNS